MKVTVYPADMNACGRYRLIWPIEVLQAQGHDVRWSRPDQASDPYPVAYVNTFSGKQFIGLVGNVPEYKATLATFKDEMALALKRGAPEVEKRMLASRYIATAREMSLATGRDAVEEDVVVFQRPMRRDQVELIGALQAVGVAVVVEIDDDFHEIHPRNPAWKGANPLTDPDVHRDWLKRACDRADLVTCSTPALAARYGAHGRVRVLDNYVPARYCQTQREAHDGPVRVGWSGSVATHPGDLEQAGGGISQAIRDHDAALHVVGTGERVQKALGHDIAPKASGWVPIEDYPAALARLDVGFVPLKLSKFNEAKSHLKGVELAAVGIPFVATPTGPYRRLAEYGIGHLASTADEWRKRVGFLIRDEQYRAELSEMWRAEVADNWTIEQNAWQWWEAWALALEHRRQKVPA